MGSGAMDIQQPFLFVKSDPHIVQTDLVELKRVFLLVGHRDKFFHDQWVVGRGSTSSPRTVHLTVHPEPVEGRDTKSVSLIEQIPQSLLFPGGDGIGGRRGRQR